MADQQEVKEVLDRLDVNDYVYPGDLATIRSHIEGLEAREAALSEQVCTVTGWCYAANKRAEAAEARVRELEADAARYRWLKQWDVGIDHEGGSDFRWWAYAEGAGIEPRLDAAIDAAREAPHGD